MKEKNTKKNILAFNGATAEYPTHWTHWSRNQYYINIIDAAYSILDLLQVYHHVDGRGSSCPGHFTQYFRLNLKQ